jgi:hypothetical protein
LLHAWPPGRPVVVVVVVVAVVAVAVAPRGGIDP